VPTQEAAQLTSPDSHWARQEAVGDSEVLVEEALSEDWATARTAQRPVTMAVVKRMVNKVE